MPRPDALATPDIRVRLAVRESGLVGVAGAPSVVLLHGFGSDQQAWRHQVAALAPRFRVVVFDMMGCGQSDVRAFDPARYRSLTGYRDDLLAVCHTLGLQHAVFVGHSAGAMVGALASIEQPALFDRLVFVAGSPRYLDDASYRGGFSRDDLDLLYRTMGENYLAWAHGFAPLAAGNPERPQLGQEFARSLSAMRPDIAQSAARVIFEIDERTRLCEVPVPVLLLQARDDLAVPPQVGEYLHQALPRSRLVRLQARGHLPHLSAPEEVNREILSFCPPG